jgi:acyl CoA:acetate/3-ketoacid CoA transferase beta subunit
MSATRAEICVAACADLFTGDGEILVSPMGLIPGLGAKLARLTSEPDLLLSDGEALLLAPDGNVEGWMPYRKVFDVVANGKRHVVMGANQIDRYGNQNISAIGDHARPNRQLLGFRGAPGNTVNHKTSYWIPRHSKRVMIEAVDIVSGVGYDRAAGSPFHHIHRVVTNLAVFDFGTPDRTMRLISVHPGVDVSEVHDRTGFRLPDGEVPVTREPADMELELIRTLLDPGNRRDREVGE